MKLLTNSFATLLLSGALAACTVGDTTPGTNTGGADGGAAGVDAAGETELKWNPTTIDQPGIGPAMHYVSDTEIYAVIGTDKICMWNGTEWSIHATAPGIASAMHFVAPNAIYVVLGNKICMWDGTTFVPKTLDMAGITDNNGVAANAEFHYVSDTEMYAVIKPLGGLPYVAKWAGIAGVEVAGTWEEMTIPADNGLGYAMTYKSPTEIYATLGTKICMWNGTEWVIVSPDQANLMPAIHVVSAAEMYAVIGEKVCKWNGTAWADITEAMPGLKPEFHWTADDNILAVAGNAVTHWAPAAL